MPPAPPAHSWAVPNRFILIRVNVNITNKVPTFIGFMKLACRFGHSKEKSIFMHLYIINNVANTKNIYQSCQGITSFWSVQFSKFRLSEGTKIHWKSKLSSNFARNKVWSWYKSITLRLSLPYFWTFWSLCALFIYRESLKLLDSRYDSQNVSK